VDGAINPLPLAEEVGLAFHFIAGGGGKKEVEHAVLGGRSILRSW
jgi:hypothetical protein